MKLSLLTLLASATALTPSAAALGDPVEWDTLAREFLSARGLESATPATADPETVLGGPAYVTARFALFDVRIPAADMESAPQADLVAESLLAVLDLEEAWLNWTEPASTSEEAREHHKQLRKWLAGVKPRKLTRLKGGDDFFEALEAKEKVLNALEARRGLAGVVGEAPRHEITRLVLSTSRRSLLEHNAYAGWLSAENRQRAWTNRMVGVNSAWIERTQVIALEGSAYPLRLDQPFKGQSLTEYEDSGLAQHVAERAAHSLTRTVYYQYGIHFFESALADNLVIEVCGRNTTGEFSFSSSWSQAGGKTQAYSRFVPGGNSAGGVLPARKAYGGPRIDNKEGVSTYREEAGANHFIPPLREAQLAAAKLAAKDRGRANAKVKVAHFLLRGEKPGQETVISAPFYGPLAEGKKLPGNEFLDDYEDFFRAYRCCFFEWLRTGGDLKKGPDAEHAEKFARLIAAQAQRQEGETLADRVEQIYGLPLSAAGPENESLEWRFLAWLGKQR